MSQQNNDGNVRLRFRDIPLLVIVSLLMIALPILVDIIGTIMLIVTALLALIVVRSLWYLVIMWRLKPYSALSDLASQGQTRAALDQAFARYDAGDKSPAMLAVITEIYYILGNDTQIERYARQAHARLQQHGLHKTRSYYARWVCSRVTPRLFTIELQQGHYTVAGDMLRDFLNHSPIPNTHRAQCALAYYLAGQMDDARRVVKKVQWPQNQAEAERDLIMDIHRTRNARDFKTFISHPLLLLATFMQAKLLGQTVAHAQGIYDVYFYALESEMLRYADAPLGRDMRPILDEMRQLFAPQQPQVEYAGAGWLSNPQTQKKIDQ